MIDVRCPICKNRHSCMEIGINPSESCGMFALDDLPKRPQTNADRIRAMSDEELAEFLNGTDGDFLPTGEALTVSAGKNRWIDWLRQEAEE